VCFSVGESECGCVDSSSFRFIPSHLTSKIVNVHGRKERRKSQVVSSTFYAACPFWVCHCHPGTTADSNTTLFNVPYTQDCISRAEPEKLRPSTWEF